MIAITSSVSLACLEDHHGTCKYKACACDKIFADCLNSNKGSYDMKYKYSCDIYKPLK